MFALHDFKAECFVHTPRTMRPASLRSASCILGSLETGVPGFPLVPPRQSHLARLSSPRCHYKLCLLRWCPGFPRTGPPRLSNLSRPLPVLPREIDAREKTPAGTPPQPSELKVEPSAMTRLKDTGPHDRTTFHSNGVYALDPRPEDPVGGDPRCGPLLFSHSPRKGWGAVTLETCRGGHGSCEGSSHTALGPLFQLPPGPS